LGVSAEARLIFGAAFVFEGGGGVFDVVADVALVFLGIPVLGGVTVFSGFEAAGGGVFVVFFCFEAAGGGVFVVFFGFEAAGGGVFVDGVPVFGGVVFCAAGGGGGVFTLVLFSAELPFKRIVNLFLIS